MPRTPDARPGRVPRDRYHHLRTAGFALIALALVAPAVAVAAQSLGREPDQPQPQPAPAETRHADLTLDGLDRGADPTIEYFTVAGVVQPGRDPRRLDVRAWALVPDGDGWLALVGARSTVVALDENLQPSGQTWSSTGLDADHDRTWATWTGSRGDHETLHSRSTRDPDDEVTWNFPEFSAIAPAGYLAPHRIAAQLTTLDGGRENIIAEPDGTTTRLGDFAALRDAHPGTGRLAVEVRADGDTGVCSGVIAPDDSATEPVWETCEHRLGAFSPDGRYLMATSPDGDGLGLHELAVLDAETGHVLVSFTQPATTDGAGQVTLVQPVWETPETLLAVAVTARTHTLVRLGVDGSLEQAADPVRAPADRLGFWLGADRTTL